MGSKYLLMKSNLALVLGLVSVLASAAVNPPSSLKGVDLSAGGKKEIALQKSDKPTVVVFMSSKCPCSKSHEAELKAMAKEFPTIQFVGVQSNSDETEEKGSEHFKAAALGFPVIFDPKSKIADAFNAEKTPHVYVVAAGGKEILYQGGVTDAHRANQAKIFYLKDALSAITAGKKPAVAEAKALGCYIKRP